MDNELQQAITDHLAGRLEAAERGYLAVLQDKPDHVEAHYNLGTLKLQQGQMADALPHFLAALELDTSNGQYWIGYIDALYKAGQIEDAKQVLELARQQGLAGSQVDELAARIGIEPVRPDRTSAQHNPGNQEIDQLLGLFGQGRFAEAASAAEALTVRYPHHEFGWKALGAVYKQLNRAEDALHPMQRAAELAPGDVEAHYNLGVTLQELGRLNDAREAYQRALQIDPGYADAHGNLGVVQQSLGEVVDAEAHYRRAVELKPSYASAHYNLGRLLAARGDFTGAEACLRRALQLNAGDAQFCSTLGEVLKAQGRLADAADCYGRALQLRPDNAHLHFNLGKTLKDMGRLDEAEDCYRNALRISPDMAEAHYNLANILLDAGLLADAEAHYRHAIEINPALADAHYNLGNTLKEMNRLVEAAASLRRAIEINPEHAEAWCNLGNISLLAGHLLDAESLFRQAIQIRPDLAEAHCNLGNTLLGQERKDEAQASYRCALQIRPDFSQAHSNLIFTQDLAADCDAAFLHRERRRWAELHANPLQRHRSFSNVADPERRLRIGYVSADFRVHSAAYVFGSMLRDFDRDHFDVYAYSNSETVDELTLQFQRSVSCWRNISRLSDDAASELIREDGIDILVDLSGHSAGNRLLVFARKPAPIQITAWGYAAGTGMDAMDVLFSDPVFIPPEEQPLYAEKIAYLPCAIACRLPQGCPDVNALPARSNGCITFGSFNRLVKNSERVYDTWASILQRLPDSRMVLKSQALDNADTRARVKKIFAGMEIDPERILLLGKTSRDAHMAAFNQIDIALDPFPHGGGVTALEGLMMGVPVVTLKWPTLTGRVSSSILTSLNLVDWIADTREQYVDIAVQKAHDLQSLAELRGGLRSRFLSSAIGDQKAYVRAAECEYRRLWRQWCASEAGDADEQ